MFFLRHFSKKLGLMEERSKPFGMMLVAPPMLWISIDMHIEDNELLKGRLYINLLTKSPLVAKEEGRRLLDIWIDNLQSYLPDVYGNYEPFRDKFDKEKVGQCLEKWSYAFHVKKSRPRMTGGIFMGGGKIPTHGWVHIILEFRDKDQNEVVSFAKAISRNFGVEFGFLHLMTKHEFGEGFSSGVHSVRKNSSMDALMVTTHELKIAVPDIYWGTFFGPSYVELFGPDAFTSLPACVSVEELSRDSYYLQLSNNIFDLERDFGSFSQCREKVKEGLGSNAFFDARFGPEFPYLVPLFDNLS